MFTTGTVGVLGQLLDVACGPVRTPIGVHEPRQHHARCRAPTRRARAAARRRAAPPGGRPARTRRPRTTRACASTGARRSGRRCGPPAPATRGGRPSARRRGRAGRASSSLVSSLPVRKWRVTGNRIHRAHRGTCSTGATTRPSPGCSRGARGCCGAPSAAPRYAQVNRSAARGVRRARSTAADWDVALLQEAPPRWLRRAADGLRRGAARSALTSRNSLAPLRCGAGGAEPRPDRLRRGRVEHGAGARAVAARARSRP